MEHVKLTKEKLEEYVVQVKRGELELEELESGLIAVHGASRTEMTPKEFLDFLDSTGLPLDMSDELRKEFEAMKDGR